MTQRQVSRSSGGASMTMRIVDYASVGLGRAQRGQLLSHGPQLS